MEATEGNSMKFTIIHRGDGMWEVHQTGCRDIAKTMASANGSVEREADNADQLIQNDLDENDGELRSLGYDDNFYHVKPCAAC